MGWLWRCFNGEEDFWGLVWIYGVLLVIVYEAAGIGIRLFTDIDIDSPAGVAGAFCRYLEIVYSLWLLVSLWRCAFNTSLKWSAYLFRFLVIIYGVIFCALSYAQKKALAPEEIVAAAANTKQLAQVIRQLHLEPAIQYVIHWTHTNQTVQWLKGLL